MSYLTTINIFSQHTLIRRDEITKIELTNCQKDASMFSQSYLEYDDTFSGNKFGGKAKIIDSEKVEELELLVVKFHKKRKYGYIDDRAFYVILDFFEDNYRLKEKLLNFQIP